MKSDVCVVYGIENDDEKEGFVWMKKMMKFKENESINAKQETHEDV